MNSPRFKSPALIESGDTLRVTTSNVLTIANVFIYVMQFSI